MNDAKIQEVLSVMKAEKLRQNFNFMVDVANIPYLANRKALVAISLKQDAVAGRASLEEAVAGIDTLIGELEMLRESSARISKAAVAAVRSA